MATDISNDIRKALVITQIIINILFIAPFMVYNMRRLSLISNSILVEKRHPRVLWFQGIFVIAWFAFIAPIMALDFSQLTDFSATTQEILSRLNCILYPFVSYGFTATGAWRFWLIFFDLKYNSSQKNNEWKFYLDAEQSERVFWLVHHRTYGSYFWTKNLFLVIYCVNVFIMIICYQIVIGTAYIMVGHLVSILCHTCCIVVMFLIWWKLPPYKDDLYIRKEVILLIITQIISNVFTDITIAVCLILSYNVIFMITSMSGSLIVFAMAFISFWWIPQKVVRIESEEQILRTSSLMSRTDSSSMDAGSMNEFKSGITNKERDKQRNKQKFNHTLRRLSQDGINRKKSHDFFAIAANPSTFKMLMQHLGKEFSLENMLSFVEFAQYKFALKLRSDRIDPKLIDNTDVFDKKLPMSNVVEMSAINKNGFNALSSYQQRDEDSTKLLREHAKNVCIQLYKKYIKVGAELEINIAYDDRIALKTLIDNEIWFMESNIKINELFTMFDDSATEVLRLLRSAFFRFQRKPVFKVACQILDESIKK